jgi:HSP20 family protein
METMTVLTRWEPFRELATLQNRMSRLFEEQYGGSREESLTSGAFVPAVDIYEDEHTIQLKLEVPGIDEKDLNIKVENNTLTVSGERKFEKDEKEENFHRVERRYGSFTRSFTLPNTVSTDGIQADYDHGVLKIRLAKRAEAKPKQIKVNVGQKPIEGKKEPQPQGQAQTKTQAA